MIQGPEGSSTSPVASDEEAALIGALRSGDPRAFERLVVEHGPRVRAVALRLLRNEADAHDVVQETFLAAFRSLTSFRGHAAVGTWLHRIAVNCSLMRLRARARRPEVDIYDLLPRFEDGGQHREQRQPFRDMPDDEVARQESCAIVRRCIDELPEAYRNALVLKDIEEMDYPEVAVALGVTVNAARIRIHRARQALRGLLAPHFAGES